MIFSFVYEQLKDHYSPIGRESKDPVMMFKILILEYLYNLSDVRTVERIKTDVAFRWFLGLKLDDTVPDDTTVSFFRINHVGEEKFEELFNEVVIQCIDKGLVKSRRYLIDSTDVAANVNYPSEKKLARKAFEKVIKELEKFNVELAKEQLEKYENGIQKEYDQNEHVKSKRHFEITREHLGYLYIKTYDLLQENNKESSKYQEAFDICYTLVNQYLNNEKDKIVSIVDPEARVAHKSPGNIKRGYKDHILVDEDSEIILSSVQTPFNVGDEKKLIELVEKVESNFEIKPVEITADKVYGTTDNRAYLKDNEITANIAFYNESIKEAKYFGLKDFEISEDVSSVKCPNGIISIIFNIVSSKDRQREKEYKVFKFDRKDCDNCKFKDKCLAKDKNGKFTRRSRDLDVPIRYDAILNDLHRVTTREFELAYNMRYKVERRFATMVRNHGLRRCRFLKLKGSKIHIIMANIVCNIVRMINILLHQPSIAILKN
ncbi:MAG: IS1182 family transposase [Sedimentibacter sp.]